MGKRRKYRKLKARIEALEQQLRTDPPATIPSARLYPHLLWRGTTADYAAYLDDEEDDGDGETWHPHGYA